MVGLFKKPPVAPALDVPDRDSPEVIAAAEKAKLQARLERGPQGTVLAKKPKDAGPLARAVLLGE